MTATSDTTTKLCAVVMLWCVWFLVSMFAFGMLHECLPRMFAWLDGLSDSQIALVLASGYFLASYAGWRWIRRRRS